MILKQLVTFNDYIYTDTCHVQYAWVIVTHRSGVESGEAHDKGTRSALFGGGAVLSFESVGGRLCLAAVLPPRGAGVGVRGVRDDSIDSGGARELVDFVGVAGEADVIVFIPSCIVGRTCICLRMSCECQHVDGIALLDTYMRSVVSSRWGNVRGRYVVSATLLKRGKRRTFKKVTVLTKTRYNAMNNIYLCTTIIRRQGKFET
ncbi:hypothetical protein JB92DRAFT_1278833 [Gautieria morchelliformis]|nr:hypothetical protein JB92DRAFT_1278833 [Gautieria morchelliformis]